MSKKLWRDLPIEKCLSESFAGEWGAEPNPANARVLRATDINNEGQINLSGGAHRRIATKKLAEKRLLAGDILLEGSGGSPEQPVGRVAFFPGIDEKCDFLCSNFFRTLRPDPFTANPRFLFWKLMWFYKQPQLLSLQQQTTGLINLKFDEYKESTVSIPDDISEQEKIAEVLDTLDTAIHQTKTIFEKLKQIKQGLLHDLLTRGVNTNGELRPSYEEAPELYQESPLGWIPKDWDTRLLGASITLISGQHIATDLCNAVGKGVPYFTGPSDFIGATTVVTSYTTRPQVMCEVGDLLITVKGSGCGKVAVAGVRACISRQLMAIRVTEMTRPYWLAVFQSLQEQFNRMATGGNIPGIGRDQILGLEQSVPKRPEEMEAIGIRLQAIDVRLTTEEEKLAKLRAQKAGLMDDLLTGRVRITPLLAQ